MPLFPIALDDDSEPSSSSTSLPNVISAPPPPPPPDAVQSDHDRRRQRRRRRHHRHHDRDSASRDDAPRSSSSDDRKKKRPKGTQRHSSSSGKRRRRHRRHHSRHHHRGGRRHGDEDEDGPSGRVESEDRRWISTEKELEIERRLLNKAGVAAKHHGVVRWKDPGGGGGGGGGGDEEELFFWDLGGDRDNLLFGHLGEKSIARYHHQQGDDGRPPSAGLQCLGLPEYYLVFPSRSRTTIAAVDTRRSTSRVLRYCKPKYALHKSPALPCAAPSKDGPSSYSHDPFTALSAHVELEDTSTRSHHHHRRRHHRHRRGGNSPVAHGDGSSKTLLPRRPSSRSPPRESSRSPPRSSSSSSSFSSSSEGDEDDDDEWKDDPIRKKTREYNVRLRDFPDDVDTWMEFIRFQEDPGGRSSSFMAGGDVGSNDAGVGSRRQHTAVREKQLSIFRRAIEANPYSIRLLLAYLRMCEEALPSDQLVLEWEDALHRVKSVELWMGYVDFRMGKYEAFTVGDMRGVFDEALRGLRALRDGDGGRAQRVEDAIAAVTLQACLFEMDAGYAERGLATLQAVIEFNCLSPAEFYPRRARRDAIHFFRAFWESEVPRVGDVGARGWAAWHEAQRTSHHQRGGGHAPNPATHHHRRHHQWGDVVAAAMQASPSRSGHRPFERLLSAPSSSTPADASAAQEDSRAGILGAPWPPSAPAEMAMEEEMTRVDAAAREVVLDHALWQPQRVCQEDEHHHRDDAPLEWEEEVRTDPYRVAFFEDVEPYLYRFESASQRLSFVLFLVRLLGAALPEGEDLPSPWSAAPLSLAMHTIDGGDRHAEESIGYVRGPQYGDSFAECSRHSLVWGVWRRHAGLNLCGGEREQVLAHTHAMHRCAMDRARREKAQLDAMRNAEAMRFSRDVQQIGDAEAHQNEAKNGVWVERRVAEGKGMPIKREDEEESVPEENKEIREENSMVGDEKKEMGDEKDRMDVSPPPPSVEPFAPPRDGEQREGLYGAWEGPAATLRMSDDRIAFARRVLRHVLRHMDSVEYKSPTESAGVDFLARVALFFEGSVALLRKRQTSPEQLVAREADAPAHSSDVLRREEENDARKEAKRILKSRRQDLQLWSEFARFEFCAGNVSAARRVYETVLSTLDGLETRSPMHFCLFRSLAEMELHGSSGSSAVSGRVQTCRVLLRAIGLHQSDGHQRGDESSVISAATLLRARKAYQRALGECGPPSGDSEWFHVATCMCLLEYASVGRAGGRDGGPKGLDVSEFARAVARLLPLVERPRPDEGAARNRHRVMPGEALGFFCSLLRVVHVHRAGGGSYPPVAHRRLVEAALEHYPSHPLFLRLLVEEEERARIQNRLRRWMDRSVRRHPSHAAVWFFAVHSEMYRASAHGRVRALFERALDGNTLSRRSHLLWTAYFLFEMRIARDPEAARNVFFRAIHRVPYAKDVWMCMLVEEGWDTQIRDSVVDLVQEKGLRARQTAL